MATPVPVSYNAPLGKVLAAGRTRHANAMLDLIAAAPANSWIKANTNTISSVFPASDYRPWFMAGPGDPSAIIRCWSGFGWDSNRSRLCIFGGGHANYSGNDFYIFDMRTRTWQLGFTPSEAIVNAAGGFETVDGPFKAPMSAHTYGNNNYLPVLDRFITFGGANHSSGGAMVLSDASRVFLRYLPGGYLCDTALAGQGFMGGAAGSNPQRGSSAGVSLPGANAWKPRDYLLDHANTTNPPNMTGHVNAGTVVTKEAGVDVVYVTGSSAGNGSHLFRIAYPSLDYRQDQITQVGLGWTIAPIDTGLAYDTVNKCVAFLSTAITYAIYFWDLDYAGPSNKNDRVPSANLVGPAAAEFLAVSPFEDQSMVYDPKRGRFVIWGRGGAVFAITVPAGDPIPATGWTVTKLCDATTSPRPQTAAEMGSPATDTGVTGKWKYSPEMDVFVGLQHNTNGDVWVFCPDNWIDPRI
jgi:hypothetical protein